MLGDFDSDCSGWCSHLACFQEDHSRSIKHLLENNRKWAEDMHKTDPDYFSRVASQQKPKCARVLPIRPQVFSLKLRLLDLLPADLWIGCADSRVPAHQVLGLPAGGVFVHRNVANLVVSTDMNMLSVLEYAGASGRGWNRVCCDVPSLWLNEISGKA
jgi:hypothetical protein